MARRNKGLQLSLVIHAVVYVVVIAGLWRLNQTTATRYEWASIVAWGWGIGLAAHASVWMMLRSDRGSPSGRRIDPR